MVSKQRLKKGDQLLRKEIEMLTRASSLPIVFDEDSPELTEADLKGFRRVSEQNRLE